MQTQWIYILSNIIAVGIVVGFIIFGLFFEKFSWKVFTTKNIAISGLLIALSIILTNVIGYSVPIFGFQIMLGNFVIFLTGMMFGPLVGVVNGVLADLVGFMINSSGGYHAGFMMIKALMGLSGSLVFAWGSLKWWIPRAVGYMSLTLFLQLFLITPVSLWALYGTAIASMDFVTKFIKWPVELVSYSLLSIASFRVLYILIKSDYSKYTRPWCLRKGPIPMVFDKQLLIKLNIPTFEFNFKKFSFFSKKTNVNKSMFWRNKNIQKVLFEQPYLNHVHLRKRKLPYKANQRFAKRRSN